MVIKHFKKFAKEAKKKYKNMVEDTQEKEEIKVTTKKKKETAIESRYIHIALIDITKGALIIIGLLVGFWVLYEIRDIIFILIVSVLFAAALDPTVDQLEKYKIPRSISIILIFTALIALMTLFVSNFVPILARELLDLARQAQDLISNLAQGNITVPTYLEWIKPIIQNTFSSLDSSALSAGLETNLSSLGDQLLQFSGNAFKIFLSISNGIANAILVLLLTYFLTVDEHLIDKFIHSIFPSKYGSYITQKTSAIKLKIGMWLRGQIVLMIAVGLASYIGLAALGVNYAFTLAMFAGITELIPVIGPIIALIAVIPIAANDSGLLVLWVSILYFGIQRLENNILVPVIMNKATGLHPIIVVLSMLVGYRFMGIVGVIISIPLTASIGIFLEDYLKKSR
jgi:predicted PurR-regulated permease PerM